MCFLYDVFDDCSGSLIDFVLDSFLPLIQVSEVVFDHYFDEEVCSLESYCVD